MAQALKAFRKAANKGSKAAEKKVDKPANHVDASEISKQLAEFKLARKQAQEANNRAKKVEDEIIKFGLDSRQKVSQAQGRVEPSVVMVGDEIEVEGQKMRPSVMLTVRSDCYRVRKAEAIQEVLDGEYETYFDEKTTVALKKEKLADTELIKKLIDVCGGKIKVTIDPSILDDEKLAREVIKTIGGTSHIEEVFDVTQTVKANSRFTNEMVLNTELAERAKPLIEKQAITVDRPSLR